MSLSSFWKKTGGSIIVIGVSGSTITLVISECPPLPRLSFKAEHSSLSILAAYDLGAPAGLLQKVYDTEEKEATVGIREFRSRQSNDTKTDNAEQVVVTFKNWTEHLGNPA